MYMQNQQIRETIETIEIEYLYLTTKETWHILCVSFWVVNEYDAHLVSIA